VLEDQRSVTCPSPPIACRGNQSRILAQVPRIGLERAGKSPRFHAQVREIPIERLVERRRRLFHDRNQATTPIFPLPSRSTSRRGAGQIQYRGRLVQGHAAVEDQIDPLPEVLLDIVGVR